MWVRVPCDLLPFCILLPVVSFYRKYFLCCLHFTASKLYPNLKAITFCPLVLIIIANGVPMALCEHDVVFCYYFRDVLSVLDLSLYMSLDNYQSPYLH